MTVNIKKTDPWKIVVVIAVALFLLWLAFGRGGIGRRSGDQRAADSLRIVLAVLKEANNKNVLLENATTRLKKENQQKDSIIAVIVKAKEKNEEVIAESGIKIKKLQKSLNQAYDQNDTSAIVRDCDSLRKHWNEREIVFEYHQSLFDEYQHEAEGKFALYEQEIATKDSINANLNGSLLTATSALQYGKQEIEIRDKEITKERRKLRVEKTLSRITSGAILLLGALLILK